ncbi:uncharacterized protein LOC132717963 [Ruditapes philippinarum]|uniref:uncharacterized protein LOC132717963 n=1 Tax=Ruditapes philippinarum TaxID=129788 RepID=UPI00295BF0AA|nr:uncharacterized protein LOC132717963 [Ruditapes philippinarum]
MKLSCILVLAGAFIFQASAEQILTDEEIQMMRNNNYTITVDVDSSTITYEHTGVPDHTSDKGWGNNNDAEIVNHRYTLPLKPTVSSPKGCAGGLGVVGLAVSGAAFYNPYTGFGWDAVHGECAEELDSCRGHPSPNGAYHYHGVPECLYTGDLADKFLGVALDGYPIYGPMDSTGKNWTSAELDKCHGHTYNGRYMYRATYDFPYLISCFHGNSVKAQQSGPGGGNGGNETRPPPMDGRPPGDGPPNNDGPNGGGEMTGKCFTANYRNWDSEICYVVCKNPGNDLENCSENDIGGSTSVFDALSVIYILVAAFVVTHFCH